jgi:hypothetical protein
MNDSSCASPLPILTVTTWNIAPREIRITLRAMSRQLGPSIVLSVLIVCFFAVALFQHDPPRALEGRSGKAAGATAASPGLPARPWGAVSGPIDWAGTPIRRASRREETAPTADHSAPRGSASLAPARRDSMGDFRAGVVPGRVAAAQDAPPAATGGPLARVSRLPAGSMTPAGGSLDVGEPEPQPQQRTAFTAVRPAETIEDVALRVYGTSAEADALWRANRDALPRRDCPLVAGMLLRTPQITR